MLQLFVAWLGAALFVASLLYFLVSYLVRFGSSAGGDPLEAITLNVILFSAFALHHSLLARTRFKAQMSRAVGPQLERAVYTIVASLLFVLVCGAWQPVPGVLYSLPSPWSWVGFGAQAAGILLTAAGARALDVLELAGVRQVLDARSRDASTRPAALKTDGVYRLVRHPLYLGWALFVFGAPHMTMTRFVFAVVSTLYLAIAIPLEERALVDTFGDRYERYRRAVRWRMLPPVY